MFLIPSTPLSSSLNPRLVVPHVVPAVESYEGLQRVKGLKSVADPVMQRDELVHPAVVVSAKSQHLSAYWNTSPSFLGSETQTFFVGSTAQVLHVPSVVTISVAAPRDWKASSPINIRTNFIKYFMLINYYFVGSQTYKDRRAN